MTTLQEHLNSRYMRFITYKLSKNEKTKGIYEKLGEKGKCLIL